jgi:hypothetical protein
VWRVLDEAGAVSQVVIKFDQEYGEASLAWRSIEGGSESITPLDLTVDEYFELSIAACSADGWPLLFASDRSVLTPEQAEDFLNALRDITPPAQPDAVLQRRRTS